MSLQNPKFETSILMGKECITEDQLKIWLQSLEGSRLRRRLLNKGIATSKEFKTVILRINFDLDVKNRIEGEKSKKEKEQAKKNTKIVEDFCNEYAKRKVSLMFFYRSDFECALVDRNRIENRDQIQEKLKKVFDEK